MEDNMKVSLLISYIGKRGYSIMKDLVAPVKHNSCTYEQLTKVLSDQFRPTPLKLLKDSNLRIVISNFVNLLMSLLRQ